MAQLPRFPRALGSLATAALLLAGASPACSSGHAAAAAQQAVSPADSNAPTLVVLITVDQLRGDYYGRWASQLDGGIARLYRGGASFVNAHQDHANTETAPGHASTLSGRHPRSTGIARNVVGVQDTLSPLVDGDGPGASPARFRGTTLVDWLRARDPNTRALSVSRKDRGAILPLGRGRHEVYWYSADGKFTTSRWYADTLPTWVQRVNARGVPAAHAGFIWTPLVGPEQFVAAGGVLAGNDPSDSSFAHQLPADTASAVQVFSGIPMMDDLIADAALEGLVAMRLGAGPSTDVLAVSFSTMDAVGHRFGPDSRELHDMMLRLDRTVGRFLDSLYTLRDSSRVIVALTSDHGVAPLPGTPSRDPNQDAERVQVRPLVLAVDSALQARGVRGTSFVLDGGAIFVNRAALSAARVPADSVLDAFAAAARRIPGVQRVDRFAQLYRADLERDHIARRWVHMFNPDQAPELAVTLTPYSSWGSPTYFQHGIPHDHDTHVPVVFYGPPFRAGTYTVYTRTVDIGPTLAHVLGVRPTEPVDGRVLSEAVVTP